MSDADRHIVTFDESAAGERLDRALAAALPTLTRSRVKALIEGRRVALAGRHDDRRAVPQGQNGRWLRVDVPEPEPAMPLAQAIGARDPLRGRRPAGAEQAGRDGGPSGARQSRPDAGECPSGPLRRQPVRHRRRAPARASSIGSTRTRRGSWSWPRTTATHQALSKLFAAHDLDPHLQGAGLGRAEARAPGRSRRRIGRHPVDRKRMAVRKTRRPAAHHRILAGEALRAAAEPVASLVGAKLGTGRTHQVRVHLAHIGCPVVGDPVYGRKSRNGAAPEALKAFPRQALHAAVLDFGTRPPGR